MSISDFKFPARSVHTARGAVKFVSSSAIYLGLTNKGGKKYYPKPELFPPVPDISKGNATRAR